MLTCRDFDRFMVDYLDDDLPVKQRLACWLHVTMCRDCARYVREYRRTIALGKQAFEELDAPVPDDVPEDLIKAALSHRKGTAGNQPD